MCHKLKNDGFRNSISFLKNILVVLSRNCTGDNARQIPTLISQNVCAKGINVTFWSYDKGCIQMSQQCSVSIVYISKGLPLKSTPTYWFTQLVLLMGKVASERKGLELRTALYWIVEWGSWLWIPKVLLSQAKLLSQGLLMLWLSIVTEVFLLPSPT